jgi:Ser/Thr protein kinase RdoA (MazF antagonist)
MIDVVFITQSVAQLYGFQAQAIEPLQLYSFDWRGIYRLRDEEGQEWVLRALHDREGAATFQQASTFLQWLQHRGYPAPQVCVTLDQQLVGVIDEWSFLLISFIPGTVLAPLPADLRQLGARVGQLHALGDIPVSLLHRSRCHPEQIASQTVVQLKQAIAAVPSRFRPMLEELHSAMFAIVSGAIKGNAVTHGDPWYLNAVKTNDARVILIDWDNVGMGLPVLDLGYLLLSSHFDGANLMRVEPDAHKISALLVGYQQHYSLSAADKTVLPQAVQFLPAFQLGRYVLTQPHLQADDPFLCKAQVRFNASAQIAAIAAQYFT